MQTVQIIYIYLAYLVVIRYGVVANIIASHAIARGSIPRVGTTCAQSGFFNHMVYHIEM